MGTESLNAESRAVMLNRIVFLSPILLIIIMLTLKVAAPPTYLMLVQEDGVIEYLQSLFYFLASVFAMTAAVRLARNGRKGSSFMYALASVALFLISMEEISWGQRLMHIGTPRFFSMYNTQNEISLHNLYPVQTYLNIAYVTIGCYGAFAWRLLPRALRPAPGRLSSLYVPAPTLMFYFLPVAVIYVVLSITVKMMRTYPPEDLSLIWHFVDNRDQEPAELLLSLGFFIFMVINNRRVAAMGKDTLSE